MVLRSFFNKKKVLLFAPNFFGYGLAICQKLKSYGAEVDYYDERPGNDFITKALIRINKSLLSRKTHNYYKKIILSLNKDHYDYVLFLNLEAISKNDLQALKEIQPNATFIMYMWDSIKNKKHTASLLTYFDLKHTFDKNDSAAYNEIGFNFRPLFYLDEYKQISDSSVKDIDLLFVGTIHSDRYELLREVRKKCDKLLKTVDFYMFFQSRKLYYARKTKSSALAKALISEFKFSQLSKNNLIEKLSRSKAVLDIQHPSQTGLTMRTIEMIGARKKIITTNHHIQTYDFYNPKNILILNRDKIEFDSSFFDNDYEQLPDVIYHKYSIDGWLEDVFSL